MEQRPKKLPDGVRETVKRKHYANRTSESYIHFLGFNFEPSDDFAWRPANDAVGQRTSSFAVQGIILCNGCHLSLALAA
jgi:hypothetical protein